MTTMEDRLRKSMANHLSHPENPHAVLGGLDFWTSDMARLNYTDAERLAAIDAIMRQHQEAVSDS